MPEPRLLELAELYNPKKITYATVEYVDVGGMVRDRARDAAVLAPLREVDALAHVLRVFDDPAVPHPAGSVDPLRDAESLDLELMLSDLEQIERRIERLEKDLKKKKDTLLERERDVLLRCKRPSNRKSRCANSSSRPKSGRCSPATCFFRSGRCCTF